MKREIGLLEATLSGVGIILGAGIYVLIGKAAGLAGNAIWASFLLAASIAVLSGLSYAELSSMFPKAGAEYVYTRKAFGEKLAFLIGWLIILSGLVGGATVALGFAGYFNALFGAPQIPVALGLILAVSAIIFYGIKESALLAVTFTLIEVCGLLLVILVGLPYLGTINYFETPSLSGVFAAAALVFFAFIGFEEIVKLAEETRRPEEILPRALLFAIAITTTLYVLVALASVSVLNWNVLGATSAPLADVAATVLGRDAFTILTFIALFATANTVLLILLATSRILYGMAAEESLPLTFSRIHPGRRTPWVAIVIVMITSMLFALIGEISIVAGITNFTVFTTFIVVNYSVIFLRFKKPEIERAFKIPVNIGEFPVLPVIGAALCAFMLTNLGLHALGCGLGLLITGYFVYKGLKAYRR